jgi:hypothetical protein
MTQCRKYRDATESADNASHMNKELRAEAEVECSDAKALFPRYGVEDGRRGKIILAQPG